MVALLKSRMQYERARLCCQMLVFDSGYVSVNCWSRSIAPPRRGTDWCAHPISQAGYPPRVVLQHSDWCILRCAVVSAAMRIDATA
jgi:hypothetical protein